MLAIARDEAKNQTFNITYGGARSLNQMIEVMREQFPGIQVTYHPRDKLMPERGTLSVEKAKRLLGYAPAYPLEKGFVRYIEWYKQLAHDHPEFFTEQRVPA